MKAGGKRFREESRCVVREGGAGAGGRWPRQWRLDSVEHGKNQDLPGYPGAPAMEGFGAGMP